MYLSLNKKLRDLDIVVCGRCTKGGGGTTAGCMNFELDAKIKKKQANEL